MIRLNITTINSRKCLNYRLLKPLAVMLFVFFVNQSQAQNVSLALNINPTGSGLPLGMYEFDGKLFFSASDGVNGRELWSFDGAVGTLEADINTILPSASISYLITYEDELYFMASDSISSSELWKFDGNTATEIDINPNGASVPREKIVFNDKLYFAADNGTNGSELMSYDAVNGVVLVNDINPNGSSGIREIVEFNNKIVFAADDDVNGFELWEYDGVNAPTMIADVLGAPGGSYPKDFFVYNGKVYFSNFDGVNFF